MEFRSTLRVSHEVRCSKINSHFLKETSNIEARNAITGLLHSDGTHPHCCKAGDGGFNEYPSGTISLNKLNTRL
jgi:hypothetical protein